MDLFIGTFSVDRAKPRKAKKRRQKRPQKRKSTRSPLDYFKEAKKGWQEGGLTQRERTELAKEKDIATARSKAKHTQRSSKATYAEYTRTHPPTSRYKGKAH